jgi:hypothetical protein
LLTGQTGQFVAGAPSGSGFVPDYIEPGVVDGPVSPMEARRGAQAEPFHPGWAY